MADKKFCLNCGQSEGRHAAKDFACPVLDAEGLFRKDLFFKPVEESAPEETVVHSICQDCFKCEHLKYDGFPGPIYRCDGKPCVPSAAIKAFMRCPFPEWRVEKKDKYREAFEIYRDMAIDSNGRDMALSFKLACEKAGLK